MYLSCSIQLTWFAAQYEIFHFVILNLEKNIARKVHHQYGFCLRIIIGRFSFVASTSVLKTEMRGAILLVSLPLESHSKDGTHWNCNYPALAVRVCVHLDRYLRVCGLLSQGVWVPAPQDGRSPESISTCY